jgi:hypothetical protein
MWTHYLVMDFWSENIWIVLTICTSHTHEIFNIIFKKYSYKDLIFDNERGKKHGFENFITKAFAKI